MSAYLNRWRVPLVTCFPTKHRKHSVNVYWMNSLLPYFSLWVKTHFSKMAAWAMVPGLHQPAPGFSRPVLSLQYQTSSHSTNLQIQEKMALTQCRWYLFLTYESRTPSESSTSRFSLRQVIEPLWPRSITPSSHVACLANIDRASGLYHCVLIQPF